MKQKKDFVHWFQNNLCVFFNRFQFGLKLDEKKKKKLKIVYNYNIKLYYLLKYFIIMYLYSKNIVLHHFSLYSEGMFNLQDTVFFLNWIAIIAQARPYLTKIMINNCIYLKIWKLMKILVQEKLSRNLIAFWFTFYIK